MRLSVNKRLDSGAGTSLIATHNSCTGLQSKSIWHSLLVPFARCQSKTITEQLEAGCTYYDIRVREMDYNGHYRVCHGLWKSAVTLDEVMRELTHYAINGNDIMADITYEGSFGCDEHKEVFLMDMDRIAKEYPDVTIVNIGVKRPEWTVLHSSKVVYVEEAYWGISWRNKNWWLPVPYFWALLQGPAGFNGKYYRRVDFL